MNYNEEVVKIVKHYTGRDITGMRYDEGMKWVWRVLTDLIEEIAELKDIENVKKNL